MMKVFKFGIFTNIIAAIALVGAGAQKMNNLDTSIPAILCVIAAICGIVTLTKRKEQ